MDMDMDVNYAQTSYVHTDDKKDVSGDSGRSDVEMRDEFLVGEEDYSRRYTDCDYVSHVETSDMDTDEDTEDDGKDEVEEEERACTNMDWSYDAQETQEDVQMCRDRDEVDDQTIQFYSFVKLSTVGRPAFYQPHFCIRGPLITNSQYWRCEVGPGATIGLNAMSLLFKDNKSQEEWIFESYHLGDKVNMTGHRSCMSHLSRNGNISESIGQVSGPTPPLALFIHQFFVPPI